MITYVSRAKISYSAGQFYCRMTDDAGKLNLVQISLIFRQHVQSGRSEQHDIHYVSDESVTSTALLSNELRAAFASFLNVDVDVESVLYSVHTFSL